MKSIKKFVAFEAANPSRGYYSFEVYQIKRNELVHVTNWRLTYAATKWPESEVQKLLADLRLIPKKYSKLYYHWRDAEKSGFKISYKTTPSK